VGVALISMGALAWVAVSFGLRTRAPKVVVVVLLAVSGALVAAGGLLVQSGVTDAEWVITVGGMAAGACLETRMMLGPFGKPAPVSGTVSPRR
jgi:hypothetical protein